MFPTFELGNKGQGKQTFGTKPSMILNWKSLPFKMRECDNLLPYLCYILEHSAEVLRAALELKGEQLSKCGSVGLLIGAVPQCLWL